MPGLQCEMCGSTNMLKEDGVFVCQSCGMKYSAEEAKKMMIEGTVDVQGTVKVDNSAFITKSLQNAQRALAKEDWEEVEKYYNIVEQNAPNNMEAVFFSSYGKAMLSLTDSDYFKRQQKFSVLIRSMSVISDYYEVTNEDKEAVLRKISQYIKRMYTTTFVYNRTSLDVAGVLKAASGATGTKQWCVNLLDQTKKAFVVELQQIAAKHDDQYIKDLLIENGVGATTKTPAPTPASNSNNKPVENPEPSGKKLEGKSKVAIITGIIGSVFAWLLAIIGWALGGVSLGFAISAKKNGEPQNKYAMIAAIVALVFSLISSLIGMSYYW